MERIIGIDIDNAITTTLPVLKQYCTMYNKKVVKRNLILFIGIGIAVLIASLPQDIQRNILQVFKL